jgi:hypothetical protein
MIRRRPELDTENSPGQIVYPPSHFEKPLEQHIEEFQDEDLQWPNYDEAKGG